MNIKKLDELKKDLDKRINNITLGKKLRKFLFWAITGTIGATSIGLFFGGINIPALILSSVSMMSYSFYEFDSKGTNSILNRLNEEKKYLEDLKSGKIEIKKEDNAEKRNDIKEIHKEKAIIKKSISLYNLAYFSEFSLMILSTVLSALVSPYIMAITIALFVGGHVTNDVLNKKTNELEKLNLDEVNKKTDMYLLGEPYNETQAEATNTNENSSENCNTNENENTNSNTNGTEPTQNNPTQSNTNTDPSNDAIVTEIMGMPGIRELLVNINSATTEEEKEKIVQAIVDIYSKNYNNSNSPKVNEKK